jgi:ergothioneine biosynthesis protein EgtB
MRFWDKYQTTRLQSEAICSALEKEDYVVQPVVDVSPPKWHLGHTTWFFENFILKPHDDNYLEYNADFNYVFNSYYETLGARVIRTDRGNLSRPTVDEVYRYRSYVDQAMKVFLNNRDLDANLTELLILGLNHEEQHQELLWYDIKYILGHNPLFPAYREQGIDDDLKAHVSGEEWIDLPEGLYEVGYSGNDFHFDNELGRHKVYLPASQIRANLVTNGEFLEFMEQGGYQDFNFWHAEGWDWVKNNQVKAPLYWHSIEGGWQQYTLSGLNILNLDAPVSHISYYEAAAFAQWKGMRLPTEFEWEAAAAKLNWGKLWEWTESAYLPYPGFAKVPGALGKCYAEAQLLLQRNILDLLTAIFFTLTYAGCLVASG